MTPTLAVETSPAPWPLVLVVFVGAFSALAWGLATFFRPRQPRPPRPPDEEPQDRPLDETTLEDPEPPSG